MKESTTSRELRPGTPCDFECSQPSPAPVAWIWVSRQLGSRMLVALR